MELSSIRDLSPEGYRKLSEAEAKSYTGAGYRCSPDKTPYLMRAVYRQGNGFGFRAEHNGNNVAIVYQVLPILLAEPERYEWSAVVVNWISHRIAFTQQFPDFNE